MSDWSGCGRWATNCAAPRPTFYAMESTNCASAFKGVQYRILYFFHGATAAVVSHGLIKERVVPPKEIDRAITRKRRFTANPERHTYEEA
jgi:hypothetical protein